MNELIRVTVRVPKDEYPVPMDDDKFMDAIGKAIQLIDKNITLMHNLGDVIPNDTGGDFDYNKNTNEIDLSGYVDSVKNRLNRRMAGNFQKTAIKKELFINQFYFWYA